MARASVKIRRYSHFSRVFVFEDAAGDALIVANFEHSCRIRENPNNDTGKNAVKGGVVDLETTEIGGRDDALLVEFDKSGTPLLSVTNHLRSDQLPLLDVRFEPPSGEDFYSPLVNVIVEPTASHPDD